ncbi:putative zinc finger, ZZ type domain-containing protein [Neospora caninum Liverpool]|uniref:Putative zinc finger, ZZ type domain-containing protein n=1 Tax=Neospora caninum (strain Liverpool) TaxID=572307 RepID=F0VJE3_NEOCL|nr:putative zinc finger, ZZ type domain-containing protein [Neospora caninum Liverpool]CBZ53854.1 putative zinc finger, ZZ type domain-containing protein [Neospora caninum Liverpool]CEL67849.1 TPA: zinc finger, ZZ type domain-containing protein,putative [Neospora caninum Liverpool]|eukprot:XP_003883886.1 putative zinc finger, ZZ type domain-containing protein [Neospora caninum Liverpool]
MGDTQSVPVPQAGRGQGTGTEEESGSADSSFLSLNYFSRRTPVEIYAVPLHPGPDNGGSDSRVLQNGDPPRVSQVGRRPVGAAQQIRMIFPVDAEEEDDDVRKLTGEAPEQEFMCSVCLELLWKPVVLECGHVFCFWCGYQCMNVYDVSRCPLCKNAFDKFPRVCRPLNLFLLQHFPRTTALRDREMAEFEFNRRRQSPCHLRIFDISSGASTDVVGRCSPNLLHALRERAPDIAEMMLYWSNSAGNSSSRDSGEGSDAGVRKTEPDNESKDDLDSFSVDAAMEDFEEGDTTVRPVDREAVVTGHVRNRGDDPVQAMESDSEEMSVGGRRSSGSSDAPPAPLEQESDGMAGDQALPEDSREERAAVVRDSDSEDGGDTLSHHPLFNENLLTMEDFVHYGVSCDGCGKMPIVGRRHTCVDCGKAACDFDLCGACQDAGYNKPGRFNQNHSADHEVRLVEHSAAEWWIQSLNRMRKIHPELSVHQILQWILMHYQDIRIADNQHNEDSGIASATAVTENETART